MPSTTSINYDSLAFFTSSSNDTLIALAKVKFNLLLQLAAVSGAYNNVIQHAWSIGEI